MLEKSLRARIHTFPGRLMQRSGTVFVSGVDIRPRLNQEIGAARGRLPRRAMQRSGARVVSGVDIRPGGNQCAVNIQVRIPEWRRDATESRPANSAGSDRPPDR